MDKLKKLKEIVREQNIKVHAKEASIYNKIHPQLFNWYHCRKSMRDMQYIFCKLTSGDTVKVLDIGCGTGFLTMKAAKWNNTDITAVDLSKEMLDVMDRNLPAGYKARISLVNMEAASYFASHDVQYDLIMTSALLHHLVDIRELIDMALKNLKSGGILYIAYEPLKQEIGNNIRFFFHKIIRGLDASVFNLRLRLAEITLSADHESSLADYQTTLGGIDPAEIIASLQKDGIILRCDKFAVRANGFLAFIADKIVKSQNTFSIIFQKS